MTLCEIVPLSLQFDHAERIPTLPFCGLETAIAWELPVAQLKICGAVKDCPSTVMLRPGGLVVTVACALKLAVTERGALILTDCGFVDPVISPVKFANWKPVLADAVTWTDIPLA